MKNWSTPRCVVSKYMLNWLVTAQLLMVMTWFNLLAKVLCVVCNKPCPQWTVILITSMRTAPVHPLAIPKNWKLYVLYLVKTLCLG